MLRHVSEVVVPTRGAPFDEVQYCGEQAGFLRREHEACRERHRSALAEVSDAVRVAAVEGAAGETSRVMSASGSRTAWSGANAFPSLSWTAWMGRSRTS